MRGTDKGGSMRTLILSLLAFGIAIAGGNAFAHSDMNKSVPADGETVAAGLNQIELRFTDNLRLTLAQISRDSKQASDDIEITRIPKAFTSHVTLTVPPLAPGDYKVTWTGVGKDGHVMSGSFKFAVSSD